MWSRETMKTERLWIAENSHSWLMGPLRSIEAAGLKLPSHAVIAAHLGANTAWLGDHRLS
jgi:hypothetical protein